MLRVTKISEYGALALGFISQSTKAASAREIAEGLQLPFDITAKTLQKLKDAGFVTSLKGIHGGYKLNRPLEAINFAEVIQALEGAPSVVECLETKHDVCNRQTNCHMRGGMQKLNDRIWTLFRNVSLRELVGAPTPKLQTLEVEGERQHEAHLS